MDHTKRFTEVVAVLDRIHPASYSSVQVTAWVSLAKYQRAAARIHVGVMASTGVLDSKIQQAKDASGTGAKDITGKAITQLTQASGDSNKEVWIELRTEELDVSGGFSYIRLSVTPATAASLAEAVLFGFVATYEPVPTTLIEEIVD